MKYLVLLGIMSFAAFISLYLGLDRASVLIGLMFGYLLGVIFE